MVSGRIFTNSPAGLLSIISEDGFLTKVSLCKSAEGEIFEDDTVRETERQLKEYFSGVRRRFDLPVNPRGTDFQRSVWRVLADIPFGETRSYSEIAAAIGKPSACRAVGGAVGKNPVLIIVPCHRIISADGSIGGFSAGIAVKEYLLKLEQTEPAPICPKNPV